ncbi:MAG: PH domain-containing protein [Nanoarchaeota archaeon]|nr:PH domain-containing protein [Nanoarchaeota archaeon]MBU0962961.1 PH domain-containing protein [Nanoarchaeota archaeon]
MTKTSLHLGARWLFRINGILRLIGILFFLSIFSMVWIVKLINNFPSAEGTILSNFIVMFIALLLIFLILLEVYTRMAYNRYFYEFTPTNLRTEKGIIWKTYSNIPYERIQNVDIKRGVIARIFGFSTIMIQTAGYSMPYKSFWNRTSEGYIPAVSTEHAEKIREFLMKKIGKKEGI